MGIIGTAVISVCFVIKAISSYGSMLGVINDVMLLLQPIIIYFS